MKKLIHLFLAEIVMFQVGCSKSKDEAVEVAITAEHSFALDNEDFLLDGKPFQIISGEIHYSRIPREYWRHRIQMVKAMGCNTIATYVFWNMHEFKEGKFDWTGDLNVRLFTELCAKNGLNVLMRVGPFAHGEIRNGGLPDWLYGRPIDVRSNDPAYLFYVIDHE